MKKITKTLVNHCKMAMKSILTLSLILISVNSLNAQIYEIYRNPNGIDTFFVNKSKIMVDFDSLYNFNQLKFNIDHSHHFDSLDIKDGLLNDTFSHTYLLKIKPNYTDIQYTNLLKYLKDTLTLTNTSHRLFGDNITETGLLIVSLFDYSDTIQLKVYCSLYGHTFLGKSGLGSKKLVLIKTNDRKLTFQFCEFLHSTGLYEFSEPNLMFQNIQTYVPNDTKYSQSWHLKNNGNNNDKSYTGTIGADINVEDAWSKLNNGSCAAIKIAIMDDGVYAPHNDLNTFGYGYNALKHDPVYTTSIYGVPYYRLNNGMPEKRSKHGTPCAGIAAGAGDNGIGITGVAYKSTVFGIKCITEFGQSTTLALYYGYILSIDSARADIISGSFAIHQSRISGYNSFLINQGINYAHTLGRKGLGTSIFHSTGNNDGDGCGINEAKIGYPASNPLTIAVTGTDVCDNLKGDNDCANGCAAVASYGVGTDIAAPYHDIWTTDNYGPMGYSSTSYTLFSGTSASSPMAAGVMGLINSANPFLNIEQTRFVIESTTSKVGGYTYNTSVTGQPNGTWSNELGYGRVNANAAVELALNTKIKFKISNSTTDFDVDETIIFKNNFNIYPTLRLYFNDNDETYGNYNVSWYRNGELILSNTLSTYTFNLPGRYFAILENNCNNKQLLKTETIDVRPDCSGVGYNNIYNTGNTFTLTTTMPTVVQYQYVPVNGDLIIGAGATLTAANRVFIMGGCSKILVENGGKLNITNCIFLGCDDWQGIICDGSTSEVNLLNTTIQDATAALISINGGKLSVTSSKFAYNYLHIGAEDGVSTTTFSVMLSKFLELKDIGAGSPACSNTEYNSLGITSEQPQVYLNNMESGNFINNTFLIYNSYTNNNIKAVYLENSEKFTFDGNNVIGKYDYVFSAFTSKELEIKNNTFENIPNGAPINTTEQGLYFDDVDNSEITNNEIKKYRYGMVFIQNMLFAVNTLLEQNKFRNNYIGLVFGSEENPIGAGSGSSNLPCSTKNDIKLVIQCNLFTANHYGVVGSGPLIDQGIPSLSAGNRFLISGSPLNIEHSFLGYNQSNPRRYYSTSTGDDYPVSNFNTSLSNVDGVILSDLVNNDVNRVILGVSSNPCTNLLAYTVGVYDIDNTINKITSFPNPTLNTINFKGIDESVKFSIQSMDGKIIDEGILFAFNPTIDLSQYNNGIYILTIYRSTSSEKLKIIKIGE